MANWFDVDKDGLAKLLESRGKAFALYELIQNAWDTEASTVNIRLEKLPGRPRAQLIVTDDDPDGFQDFTHAWTLFAESTKKGNPDKRGLFNMGEKLVLSLCDKATIQTTKGTVNFDESGRYLSKTRREFGSEFSAIIKMTRSEYDECCAAVMKLIPPPLVATTFNGKALEQRTPLTSFYTILPTTIADDTGIVRPTKRLTQVQIFEPLPGEEPSIYEKGIPVVATGDKWHVDIQQRVPLNMNRDNVTPSYLQTIRILVVNEMHEKLNRDEVSEPWVRKATADERINEEAFIDIHQKRHGAKSVIFDPSDPEANNIAVTRGYTVLGGRSLSKGEHANNRKFQAALPSGQVTPSPKPFAEDGKPLKIMPEKDWTDGIRQVVDFAHILARRLLGRPIHIEIAKDPSWKFEAAFGGNSLTINYSNVDDGFFDHGISQEVIELLLHELAHDRVKNHLSREFYDELCYLGAKTTLLALAEPEIFR